MLSRRSSSHTKDTNNGSLQNHPRTMRPVDGVRTHGSGGEWVTLRLFRNESLSAARVKPLLLRWHYGEVPHATENHGGAGRDRTGGLIVANDALSQLSYSPTRMSRFYHQASASGVRRQASGTVAAVESSYFRILLCAHDLISEKPAPRRPEAGFLTDAS